MSTTKTISYNYYTDMYEQRLWNGNVRRVRRCMKCGIYCSVCQELKKVTGSKRKACCLDEN